MERKERGLEKNPPDECKGCDKCVLVTHTWTGVRLPEEEQYYKCEDGVDISHRTRV